MVEIRVRTSCIILHNKCQISPYVACTTQRFYPFLSIALDFFHCYVLHSWKSRHLFVVYIWCYAIHVSNHFWFQIIFFLFLKSYRYIYRVCVFFWKWLVSKVVRKMCCACISLTSWFGCSYAVCSFDHGSMYMQMNRLWI